jgi:hypothetical protein
VSGRVRLPGFRVLHSNPGEPVTVRLPPCSFELTAINCVYSQSHHGGAREVVSKPTKWTGSKPAERVGYHIGPLLAGACRSPDNRRLKLLSFLRFRACRFYDVFIVHTPLNRFCMQQGITFPQHTVFALVHLNPRITLVGKVSV